MNIGLVAHDAKKKLMQEFCVAYRNILSKHKIFATGTTGRLVIEATNLNVKTFVAGHLGGIQQLCSMIVGNELDMLIFLRDPLTARSHEPDVNNMIRECDNHNIPIATNMATAEMLIKSLENGVLEFRHAYK